MIAKHNVELQKGNPKRKRNASVSAGSVIFLISRKGYYVSFSWLHYEQQDVVRILKRKAIRRDGAYVFLAKHTSFYLSRLQELTHSSVFCKEFFMIYYKVTFYPFISFFYLSWSIFDIWPWSLKKYASLKI